MKGLEELLTQSKTLELLHHHYNHIPPSSSSSLSPSCTLRAYWRQLASPTAASSPPPGLPAGCRVFRVVEDFCLDDVLERLEVELLRQRSERNGGGGGGGEGAAAGAAGEGESGTGHEAEAPNGGGRKAGVNGAGEQEGGGGIGGLQGLLTQRQHEAKVLQTLEEKRTRVQALLAQERLPKRRYVLSAGDVVMARECEWRAALRMARDGVADLVEVARFGNTLFAPAHVLCWVWLPAECKGDPFAEAEEEAEEDAGAERKEEESEDEGGGWHEAGWGGLTGVSSANLTTAARANEAKAAAAAAALRAADAAAAAAALDASQAFATEGGGSEAGEINADVAHELMQRYQSLERDLQAAIEERQAMEEAAVAAAAAGGDKCSERQELQILKNSQSEKIEELSRLLVELGASFYCC